MGGGGETARPEEKQRLHSDSGLAGATVAEGGTLGSSQTHLLTWGSEAEGSEAWPTSIGRTPPQRAPLPALLHSYFYVTALKKWNMTCLPFI